MSIQQENDPFEPIMSIGLAAEKLGISPETLRLYEREGLILPYKTPTNRRLYSHKDLEWVTCFRKQITENGLNLAGVRVLLALITCWEIKPCSQTERQNCPVFMDGERVCWLTDDCAIAECNQGIEYCRKCEVYRKACQAGKLNQMYLNSNK